MKLSCAVLLCLLAAVEAVRRRHIINSRCCKIVDDVRAQPYARQLPLEKTNGVLNLSHLTQPDHQAVSGPIQDDEALFLFAIIRGRRFKRILEIGGLNGYSATNFVQAAGPSGMVYSVDVSPVPSVASNHKTIMKDAGSLTSADIDNLPLDFVFFDCHVYEAQMAAFNRLKTDGMITNNTVLGLHDTNLYARCPDGRNFRKVEGGYIHQPAERQMVNDFKNMGYDAFSLHTANDVHDPSFPYRHGVTVLSLHPLWEF